MAGDEDEPEVGSEAWWERHHVEMQADRRRFDRLMGRRPDGEEHRAVVDHEALAGVDPGDAHEWRRVLGYLGLDALDRDDPGMPPALRDLLGRLDEEVTPPLAWILPAILLATAAAAGTSLWGLEGVMVAIPVAPLAIMTSLLGTAIDGQIRRAGIWAPLPTAATRRDAALERLRAAPFVTTLGDKLVENVPALSWLRARLDELDEAEERRADRVREIERLVERIDALGKRLGASGPDPQRAALLALERDEQALRKRIRGLRKAVAERHAALSASLDRLRAAAELATLRERSAALLGGAAPDDAARVAADLELEVTDLRRDVDALRAEIADEEARWSATAEVAALSR